MRRGLPKRLGKPLLASRQGLLALIAALALTAAGAGCGYHVVGRNTMLPKTWHTIAVPLFVNHTLHYRLGQRFTEAVVRELEARTSYRIVPNPSAADAVLLGQVTSIEAVPVMYDPTTGRATTMLVTIHAKVSLKNRRTKKVLFRDDKFVFRDEYELSTNARTFFDEENPAIGRMSRDFAARLVSDLLEGF